MKETDLLLATVKKWWPEIQTLLAARVGTAKVEAARQHDDQQHQKDRPRAP